LRVAEKRREKEEKSRGFVQYLRPQKERGASVSKDGHNDGQRKRRRARRKARSSLLGQGQIKKKKKKELKIPPCHRFEKKEKGGGKSLVCLDMAAIGKGGSGAFCLNSTQTTCRGEKGDRLDDRGDADDPKGKW